MATSFFEACEAWERARLGNFLLGMIGSVRKEQVAGMVGARLHELSVLREGFGERFQIGHEISKALQPEFLKSSDKTRRSVFFPSHK
jgi:hypothetical protein